MTYMSDGDGCKPTRWHWIGNPRANGLMRVFAAMQESSPQDSVHAAATPSGVDDAQQVPPTRMSCLILIPTSHYHKPATC